MSDYPHIGEPQRQPDGTYSVTVERAPGDSKEMSFASKTEAKRGAQALRAAHGLLASDTGRKVTFETATRIQGPYSHKTMGWRVLLTRGDDQSTIYFKTKTAAQEEIRKARLKIGRGKPIPHRPPDGSRAWCAEALDKVARRILGDPNDDQLIKVGRALSQLFASRERLIDKTEMEKRVEAAEAFIEEIRQARKHGTGSQGSRERIGAGDSSRSPVPGDSPPAQN